MPRGKFDVRNAVRFFGGPASLARRATQHGTPLTVKAIEKWQERGRIPGEWIVRMVAIAYAENRHFEIHDFIIHDTNTQQRKATA